MKTKDALKKQAILRFLGHTLKTGRNWERGVLFSAEKVGSPSFSTVNLAQLLKPGGLVTWPKGIGVRLTVWDTHPKDEL